VTFNPSNGYAAFSDDFEGLTGKQKESLSVWLETHYDPRNPPVTYEEKLAWMEHVYRQREKDPIFWSRFYRLMAYIHQGNEEISLGYVHKALPLLEQQVDEVKGEDRLPILFVLGEYHRRLGNEAKSESYFRVVRRSRHPYFERLVQERTGWKPRKPLVDMKMLWGKFTGIRKRLDFGCGDSVPAVVSLLYILPCLFLFYVCSVISFARAKVTPGNGRRWVVRILLVSLLGYASAWGILFAVEPFFATYEFPWNIWPLFYLPLLLGFFVWIKAYRSLKPPQPTQVN